MTTIVYRCLPDWLRHCDCTLADLLLGKDCGIAVEEAQPSNGTARRPETVAAEHRAPGLAATPKPDTAAMPSAGRPFVEGAAGPRPTPSTADQKVESRLSR